jgi:threonine synthase
MHSYLTHLECANCSLHYSTDRIQTYCESCSSPLLACYDLDAIQNHLTPGEISTRPKGLWRWHEILPVLNPKNIINLGEGDTPVIKLDYLGKHVGLSQLFLKDESINPSASFKSRGISVALSKAFELGIKRVVMPTAGNAGGALATYCARAGMESLVIMPNNTPPANQLECQICGANTLLVEGSIADCSTLAQTYAEEEGWFLMSTFKEPYRVEGKKIMGYEIAENFAYQLPDVIIFPTGGGTGVIGMWKAFGELLELGWLKNDRLPRMIVVQAEGCAPIVRAFVSNLDHCEYWDNAATYASGLCVPLSFADRQILQVVKKSRGLAISVSDNAMRAAQELLAIKEGIFASPEGAASYAALLQLVDQHFIDPDEQVLLFNTASGLKYVS